MKKFPGKWDKKFIILFFKRKNPNQFFGWEDMNADFFFNSLVLSFLNFYWRPFHKKIFKIISNFRIILLQKEFHEKCLPLIPVVFLSLQRKTNINKSLSMNQPTNKILI